MRKFLFLIVGTLVTGILVAGGLVTNTNQSVLFTRLQSRNASTRIDAVYYNPAGLGRLGSGFFASVNNQTINQTNSILNNYTYLTSTPKEYVGKVNTIIFPDVYIAFKIGKLAFSTGFNPIGGGGGVTYDDGLPSYEMEVSDLVPYTYDSGFETSGYSADIFFSNSSRYYGYHANVTYSINDIISVAAGIRLVTAKNKYYGYVRNISINPDYTAFGEQYNGNMVLASDFFSSGAIKFNTLSSDATLYKTVLQDIINNGGGAILLNNTDALEPYGLDLTEITNIQKIINSAEVSQNGLTIQNAQLILADAAPFFNTKATSMTDYAEQTQDKEVDAEETGMGFSPMISVNVSPNDMLNIALKYEFKTKLELETKLIDGQGGGIFTEGEMKIADMPAMLAAGVEFIPMDKMMLTASANYYFDKDVDYDGSATENVNMIDNNSMELAFGGQYRISDQLCLSAGWLGTFTGVNAKYQNEQRFSLNTHSFGGGIGLRIIPMLDVNIGGQYTIYKDELKSFDHILDANPVSITETYIKNSWIVGIGVDLYLTYENDRRVMYKK